ncbi:MAG: 4-alpha-glucanotransferase [Candidatus Cloacimonetes bacterium]|nr:4-alpha-glucanotransferase [Candidatus Cloacimonadota bacterium]
MKNLGVLLHISSLPSAYGIGDLGPEAYQFADILVERGFKYWQILPLYQTGYGNSPYNPLSAFALNPYLISPDLLYEDGLIDLPDLEAAKLPPSDNVPYDTVYRLKDQLIAKAVDNFLSDIEIYEFIESNALYMKPYLAYITLIKLYGDDDWHLFREEHRKYSEELYESLFKSYGRQMLRAACAQAMVKDQLYRLKDYLNSQGLQLIGDMPLYLAYHSAEVWSNPHLFDLDANGNRNRVAGVPADAFSENGQLWGNPLYRWDVMREDGFQLFVHRIRNALGHLDKVRLDHFIGYVNYWAVPLKAFGADGLPELPETALDGSWERARPEDFFPLLQAIFPSDRFIAEDLGILNGEVCSFRDLYELPGMIVLQFCFEESVPKVRDFPAERFLYTGTHDNPTVREWYENLAEDSPSRINLLSFIRENLPLFAGLGLEDLTDVEASIHTILCLIAQDSGCDNIIVPVQDILGLGSSARMNVPGTALGNWQWRLTDFDALLQTPFPCGI